MLKLVSYKKNMEKILDEFEFWPNLTTYYGVCCACVSEKYPIDLLCESGVSVLACMFLLEPSFKFLVLKHT